MEFKVKEVTGTEEKSQQEIEAKLLKDAEERHNQTNVEQIDMQPSDSTSDDTQDTVEMQDNVETQSSELNEDDVLSFIKNRYEKDFTSVDQLFEQREKNEELPECNTDIIAPDLPPYNGNEFLSQVSPTLKPIE